jgi:hypothetical protein
LSDRPGGSSHADQATLLNEREHNLIAASLFAG